MLIASTSCVRFNNESRAPLRGVVVQVTSDDGERELLVERLVDTPDASRLESPSLADGIAAFAREVIGQNEKLAAARGALCSTRGSRG